jgi:hypothetical protein
MAKKTKGKTKTKTKTKTKSKTKKKSTKSKTPFLVQGIGVLSSIPFTGTLRTAFNTGLGKPLPTIVVKDGLGYDQAKLEAALNELNQADEVGLIVTVGGLVTFKQALKDPGGATKYFISLVGGRVGVPGPGNGYFLGGISLESYSRNPLRIREIKRKFSITDNDEFCLLSNPNSTMTPNETNAWINRRVVAARIDATTSNPASVYQTKFAEISALQNPKVRAVQISADPHFFATGAALVHAANQWIAQAPRERIVCYPLQDYSAHRPSGGRHLLHGPNLGKTYKELGRKARKILNSTTLPSGSTEDATEEVN